MRKALQAGLIVALVSVLAVPTAAADPEQPCGMGDVQAIAKSGIQAAINSDKGVGRGDPWQHCQLRLYDDNDDLLDPFFGEMVDNPEVPHYFTDEEYFLAGIFQFVPTEVVRSFGHNELVQFFDEDVVDEFYWGPEGSDLVEFPLTHSSYRTWNSLFFGLVMGNHRYYIFEPGSLTPGTYEWRWETFDPFFGAFVAHGTVIIVDA